MKAIRVHAPGGPESMKLEEVPVPAPAAGQAQVKLEACGVNYIDVYFRTGAYKAPLPLTPGMEGAGTVTAVGPGVSDVKVGDRVAWTGIIGSYAQSVDANRLHGESSFRSRAGCEADRPRSSSPRSCDRSRASPRRRRRTPGSRGTGRA